MELRPPGGVLTARPAPFVLAIDVEPAPRYELSGDACEWDGLERTVEHIEPWRVAVLERTGAPLCVTWFMRCDAQIEAYGSRTWALEHFRGLIEDLQTRGDEFGLHVHPYVPADDGLWRQDFQNEAMVLDAVRQGVREFERHLGLPRYFRGGDNYLTNALVSELETLGVEYDLTIEPGRSAKPYESPDRGTTADYRRAPRRPYRPSKNDFLVPDPIEGRDLWMVPVTTACYHHPAVLHAGRGHPVEMLHLAFEPGFVQPFVDAVLSSGRPSVAVTRTGDIAWSGDMLPNLDYLLGHADVSRVQFVSPAEAVKWQLVGN